MDKFTSFIERYLLPVANKLSNNKYLGAITAGFSVLLPITMVGAIFTLLANLNIAPYQALISSIGLKTIFSFAPKVTTDMLSVYAVFLIGKACAEKIGIEKESTVVGTLSLLAFLVMIPLGVSGVAAESKEVVTVAAALSTGYLGAAGLFSAMIIGLIVPPFYKIFIDHNITIKMPEQVPPTISKSFSALIPAFAIAFAFSLVRLGFASTSFGTFNDFIYTVLRTPLAKLGASPLTFIVFIIMCSLMWFFGLHGGMIVMPFLKMLYMPALMENLAAYGAGAPIPNIITSANWMLYAALGGAGGTLGLCFLLAFAAKSERYKALGKIALPSGLCGINEPITFGLPMVLNTIMIIPLIITPITTFLISYICMSVGLVPLPNGVAVALGTPVVLSGFLCAGWQAAVLQIVLIIIQACIYYPFFRVLDKQALIEESEN